MSIARASFILPTSKLPEASSSRTASPPICAEVPSEGEVLSEIGISLSYIFRSPPFPLLCCLLLLLCCVCHCVADCLSISDIRRSAADRLSQCHSASTSLISASADANAEADADHDHDHLLLQLCRPARGEKNPNFFSFFSLQVLREWCWSLEGAAMDVDSQPSMEETILVGDDLMLGPPSPLIPPEIASHVLEGVDVCDGVLRNLFLLELKALKDFASDGVSMDALRIPRRGWKPWMRVFQRGTRKSKELQKAKDVLLVEPS
ncbi:hypothetical protein ACLOJK_003562 [Asimina triloba]